MDKKSLIKSAYLHFRDGRFEQAIKEYHEILKMDPSDLNALNMLGDVFSRKGRITEALDYYKQAVEVFHQQGAKEKVEIILRKMSKLDPDSVEEIVSSMAEKKTREQSPEADQEDEEVGRLKQAVAKEPKNFENYQKLGDLLVKQGRKTEASEQYLVIGNALYTNRMFAKAKVVFQRILKLTPNNLQAHIALGEIHGKEGSDSDAKKEFLLVAEQLIRQGNLDRGQLFAQKAIQLKSIEARYYMGLVYYQKEEMKKARSEFETLLKFKVSHQGALTHLAQIFNEAGQFTEAFTLYERLVKIDVKNADALEKMAETAIRQEKMDVARDKFIQAMDTFAADEQWERAASCANQAIKLDPQNHQLYLKLADASYNAGLEYQAGEACIALAEVLEAEGKSQEAEQMRSKAGELMGEVPETPAPRIRKEAPVALKAEPSAPKEDSPPEQDDTQMMMNLADTYIRQNSLDEAIEIYQKILKNDPNDGKVKKALTRVYAMFAGINPENAVSAKASGREAGDSSDERDEQRVQREARERAQREAQVRSQRSAATETPIAAKSSAQKREFFEAVGNTKEDQIDGGAQDEFMTVTVAEIYTKQGLLSEALKIYQKILEIEPGNQEAQVKKQELQKKMIEQDKLRKQAEKPASPSRSAARKPVAATKAAASTPEPEAEQPDSSRSSRKNRGAGDDQDPPPAGKGRRGRVSYV